jgi:hypothetical protein
MVRTVSFAAVLMMTAAAALGCGAGLSVEDATLRCDQEKAAKPQFVTFAAYNQCLACYEQCGDNCVAAATAPASYTCPDDSAGATSSASATSSTGTGK